MMALLFGAVAAIAGLYASRPRPAGSGRLAGDRLLPGSFQPEPAETWFTPSGRRIVSGSVDGFGYQLPLDVHRPAPAAPAMEPAELAERPEQRPADLRREARAGDVSLGVGRAQRLGPGDGHTQNRPSIDVAGGTLVAGWSQFTDAGLVVGAGRSAGGARTWTWELFDGHRVMSDPVVKAGGGKRWYFAYLAAGGSGGSDVEIYVRLSIDGGKTWRPPVAVTRNQHFDDRPGLAARDREVLVAWSDFGFSPARVRVARSRNGGRTFGKNTILVSPPAGGNGACPVIGAGDTYYVFWRGSSQEFLWMARSPNRGSTWSEDAAITELHPLPATLPGGFRGVNLPSAAADPTTGDLVVVWNDQLFGSPDILSIRSGDRGNTWSLPVRVNDDAGTDAQFFPRVTIDPAGIVHVVWYDRRHRGAGVDVYYAASADGGVSYRRNLRVTTQSYAPVLPWERGAAAFIGDDVAVAAAGGAVYPLFQDARTGVQQVYVAAVRGAAIFGDGFESGDTSSWSATRTP